MRDRLIELLLGHTDNAFKTSEEKHFIESTTIGEVADTILADGWMRPPCKVGDSVYTIFEGKIETLTVIRAMTEESTERFNRYYDAENKFLKMPFAECHIGKSVFLTREEAEAKLKEGGRK